MAASLKLCCPQCGEPLKSTKVYASRAKGALLVYRSYTCRAGHKIKTTEHPDEVRSIAENRLILIYLNLSKPKRALFWLFLRALAGLKDTPTGYGEGMIRKNSAPIKWLERRGCKIDADLVQ